MERHKLNVEELNRISIDDFKKSQKLPVCVVLDNVRSLYNVGSVFRTADAFRIEKIYLCGVTCCPPNVEIHKTALGAEDSVAWEKVEDTLQAVQRLKKEGYVVLCVEQVEGSVRLDDLTLDAQKRYALVLGHEVYGVQQQVVDESDICVEVPQHGTKHSLNVSVTAGIAMWHCYEQLGYLL